MATLILLPFLIQAQTNQYYVKGDMDFELAPTVSSYTLFTGIKPITYGASYEYEYWETAWTGTGVEIGSYDVRNLNYGIIDHTAVMQNLRLFSSGTSDFKNRFCLTLKTGAEQYFVDGSKDIEFGLGAGVAFTTKIQGEISYLQHYRTIQTKDGGTLRIGLKFKF